jgi:hypothetical protein
MAAEQSLIGWGEGGGRVRVGLGLGYGAKDIKREEEKRVLRLVYCDCLLL